MDTITATWTGGALGTISDPNDNLEGVVTGSTVASGFTTGWNNGNRIFGDWTFGLVDWSLTVPVTSLTYSFSTDSETFFEGLAFDAQFEFTSEPEPVPEPSSLFSLLVLGTLGASSALLGKKK